MSTEETEGHGGKEEKGHSSAASGGGRFDWDSPTFKRESRALLLFCQENSMMCLRALTGLRFLTQAFIISERTIPFPGRR